MNNETEIVGEITNVLNVAMHFPTLIYFIDKPEFIEEVTVISEKNLEDARKLWELDEIYPVYMSGNYQEDPGIKNFASYVGETAWNILKEQGYDMDGRGVAFKEMWTQEHYKHSSMEQHVHGNGAQIVGFYFLETPENCSRVVFHDPRPGKVQVNLPEIDITNATPASQMVNFEPLPGRLMFTNSWLPHAFTRHGSDSPIKFVHFNLSIVDMPQQASCNAPAAEVV